MPSTPTAFSLASRNSFWRRSQAARRESTRPSNSASTSYLFLPVQTALYLSVGLAALALFGMGALKSRWTRRSWLTSGLEIFALGAIAGIAGYFFGTLLPAALGVAGIPG